MSNMHPDLLAARRFAYEPSGWMMKNFLKESESVAYGACTFEINHRFIKFRVGKITPRKAGQFVTLWKRIRKGPIRPYNIEDPIDLFVVSVRGFENFGQFVFPKDILFQKGMVSKGGKGGKRAMRVYPPWDMPDNRQAKNTQDWQLRYFFEIHPDDFVDIEKMQQLFLKGK